MAFPSVQHAGPDRRTRRAHPDRGLMRGRGLIGSGIRFEAGFDCGGNAAVGGGASPAAEAKAGDSLGGRVQVSGSARRCQRHLAGFLRQHRDLLAASAEGRRSLQMALEDLRCWDRQQDWTRRVTIEDLLVTYWLRADRPPVS